MCVDANASARHAAKQRWMEKDAKYRSDSLKYFNKETAAERGMQRPATGYSRAISNDYQRALYTQGKARRQYEKGFIKYLKSKGTVDEGGRARRRTTGLREITAMKGALENAVAYEFGPNMQRRYRARLTQMQNQQAKVRNNLGLLPEYGAPVLMPPSDRLSGALSIASQIASIVGAFKGFGGTKTPDFVDLPDSVNFIA